MAERRGKHHALLLFATAAWLMALPGAPAQAQDPALEPGAAVAAAPPRAGLVQRGIPAEATAENGVIARERAHASARRIAWDRLAGQIGITRQASDSQIDDMVASIVIEEERITPTRYSGRITVNFNPSRVRAFGGGSGGEIAGASPQEDPRGALPPPLPVGPAAATIEAVARYASHREWIELRRRLASAAPVARVEVLGIAVDRARLRVALRAPPNAAAGDLARIGLQLMPPAGGPGDGWRLTLARGV
jgi:hypothetical protein